MPAILTSEVVMPADEKTVVNVRLEPSLLATIDEYRFERRFRTRMAAMTFLLAWALEQNPEPTPDDRRR